jgi:hypothetical protein
MALHPRVLWKRHSLLQVGLLSRILKLDSAPISSKPPVAPGNYLEPHYHFFTSMAPTEMFGFLKQSVQAVTQKAHQGERGYDIIDTDIQEHQFKIKCIDYAPGGGKTVFNIRIFALDGDDRYAVEFQRRQVRIHCLFLDLAA